MKLNAFDAFCRKLPGSTFVVQWGGSHVHKIGGKVYAIGNFTGETVYVFKATPLSFEVLIEQGLATRPRYLRRGTWLRAATAMPDAELRELLRQSYDVVVASLTVATRVSLGL